MTFSSSPFFFFFNDTATTEIYTLSLHDALPICRLTRSPGLFPLHQSVAVLAPTPGRVAALGTERVPRLGQRSEEHTSELQSHLNLVCRLLLEKTNKNAHVTRFVLQAETMN